MIIGQIHLHLDEIQDLTDLIDIRNEMEERSRYDPLFPPLRCLVSRAALEMGSIPKSIVLTKLTFLLRTRKAGVNQKSKSKSNLKPPKQASERQRTAGMFIPLFLRLLVPFLYLFLCLATSTKLQKIIGCFSYVC
jgi:hypothetical protein